MISSRSPTSTSVVGGLVTTTISSERECVVPRPVQLGHLLWLGSRTMENRSLNRRRGSPPPTQERQSEDAVTGTRRWELGDNTPVNDRLRASIRPPHQNGSLE